MVNTKLLWNELEERNLPNVLECLDKTIVSNGLLWEKRREEIKHILYKEFIGFPPDFSLTIHGIVIKTDKNCYGGKAIRQLIDLQITSPYSYVSFPFELCIPKEVDKPPMFLNLSFTPEVADGLGEEIIDNGFGISNVYYQDIASDKDDNFYSGVGRFCKRNGYDSWGKISMWAWGASRIMDYLMTREDLDINKVAVIGHSRLGKTSLVCGAMDERFSLVVSNNSGGAGAAIFRGKTGEGISNLEKGLSRSWFCGNFFMYRDKTEELPFDQHYLLALVAPRKLYISSASMDEWADPKSEFLSCVAASKVYEILGASGLVHNNSYPEDNQVLHEGNIGYHLRKGTHYMGRYDWNKIMEYRKLHLV